MPSHLQLSENEPLSPNDEARLHQAHVERAHKALTALDEASSPAKRFYCLGRAAQAAYCLGMYERAGELAQELLALAPSYRENFNFGNAIHDAHTALGLVALRSGDTVAAIEHLLKAGDTPGSPQLDTFGPSMELARELMKVGEFAAPAKYLKLCSTFWKMGSTSLRLWEESISRQAIPNCLQHRWR